jgi:hypothetical protein
VPHTLRELGLQERPDAGGAQRRGPRGKPHPDVFLAAAEAIDTAPGACVGVRGRADGRAGRQAAGMRVVAMTTSFTRPGFQEHGAAFDHAPAISRNTWRDRAASCSAEAGRYFSTSSKNASARESFDWPSQKKACLRTGGVLVGARGLDQQRHALVPRQLAEREDRLLLDVGLRVLVDRARDRLHGLVAGALGQPEQRLAAHMAAVGLRARSIKAAIAAGSAWKASATALVGELLRRARDRSCRRPGRARKRTLSPGRTPSSQCSVVPPASSAQSGENVRSLVISPASARSSTSISRSPSSLTTPSRVPLDELQLPLPPSSRQPEQQPLSRPESQQHIWRSRSVAAAQPIQTGDVAARSSGRTVASSPAAAGESRCGRSRAAAARRDRAGQQRESEGEARALLHLFRISTK